MPPFLAGRDKNLETFAALLERLETAQQGRSLIYSGLRGVGKTVLLLEFEKLAVERNWDCTGVVEIGTTTDFRTSISRMTHKLLRGLSRKQAIKDRVAQALGVLKAFNVTAPGGFQLSIDVSAITGTADSGDIEEDLTELLVEVGAAARAGGKGVVYLIDEMQNLEPVAMGALCMAFHKLAQQQLPVALVGAGLPPLPAQLRVAKPYAERLFEYFPLGRLLEPAPPAARPLRPRHPGDTQRRRLRGNRDRAHPRRRRRLPLLPPGVRPCRLGRSRRLSNQRSGRSRRATGRSGDPRRGVLRQPRRGRHQRRASLHGGDG
jgi:hypothetical protein